MNWLDHALVEQLGLSLLHFLWQGTLLGLLFAATLPFTRRAGAHTRYIIAVLTLAAMAAAPVLTLALLQHSSAAGISAGATGAAMEPALLMLRVTADAGSATPALTQWVVIAWLAGVLLLSARLVLGWHFLRRLRQTADFAAAAALRPRLQELVQRLGIDRTVALAVSAGIRSPVVIGWLKPLVLLPPAIVAGLPTRQIEMVLAHELAHVRRLDHLVNLCQTVIETVLFYHPVVRWVSRRIRIERENACDDLAVTVTDDRLAYVEMLATLEKLRFSGPRLALAVHDGQMLSRIRRLVERQTPNRQLGLTGPALLAGLILLAAGSLQLVEDEPARPSANAPAQAAPAPAPIPSAASAGREMADTLDSSAPSTEVGEPAVSDPVRSPNEADEQAPTPGRTDPVQAQAESAAVEAAAESFESDVEPPALPSMTTDRLPPVSELVERPRRRELAMLERPVLAVPSLPEPLPPRTRPSDAGILTGGNIIERIEPDYPSSARRRGVDGNVEVEFLVTRDGSVQDIEIIDETPRGLAFADSARDALTRWRFEPFRRGDEPIERRVRLDVSFDLGQIERRECRSVVGSRIPRCY